MLSILSRETHYFWCPNKGGHLWKRSAYTLQPKTEFKVCPACSREINDRLTNYTSSAIV